MHSTPFALLLTFALLEAPPMPIAAQVVPGDAELSLAPGDAVRLELFESLSRASGGSRLRDVERDLVHEYAIDAMGDLLLPVAGVVRAVGRPFREVRAEIERAFATEFMDAAVRVTPLLRIAVLGEVRDPRLIAVDPTMRFADVLAAAGGLTEQADQDDVRLVRADGAELRSSTRDVTGVTTPLRSGDRIVVGRRSWISSNLPFVLGAGASVVASVLTALLVR